MTERKHVIRERRADERTTRLSCWCGWVRDIHPESGVQRVRPARRIDEAVREHDQERNVSVFSCSAVRRATHA